MTDGSPHPGAATGTIPANTPNPKESLSDAEDRQARLVEQRCREFGMNALPTVEAGLDLVDIRNRLAQGFIQQGSHQRAKQLLEANDAMTAHHIEDPSLNVRRLNCRAQVFNVMTCLCKSQGDTHGALKTSSRALQIMQRLELFDELPTSYLNVCALYSSLGLHAEALQHALLALQVLRELLRKLPGSEGEGGDPKQVPHEETSPTCSDSPPRCAGILADRWTHYSTQLAITYFNIAVEQEHLKDGACLATYQVAVETAVGCVGPKHPLTRRFKRALDTAIQETRSVEHCKTTEGKTPKRPKVRHRPSLPAREAQSRQALSPSPHCTKVPLRTSIKRHTLADSKRSPGKPPVLLPPLDQYPQL
eukprot:EG_transcript_17417